MNTNKTDNHRISIEARQEQQAYTVNAFGWITCLNCEHFAEDKCKLYQAVPPPAIVVHGCKSYEEKIPF